MKPQKQFSPPQLAAIGAGIFVAILFLSYLLSSGLLHTRGTGITLPEGSESTLIVSEGSHLLAEQTIDQIDINASNVQQVIASLKRPEAYSCSIVNTIYYTGGSSSLSCRRYARDGLLRTDILDSNKAVQSTLVRDGDTIYAWDRGDSSAYQGKQGDFSDDAAAMLPTYEDVLAYDIEIRSASRQDVDYEPCIRVECEQDGYSCVYYVSASSGLLKTASFYSGDTLTRQVTIQDLHTDAPDKSLFALPNGKSLLGE